MAITICVQNVYSWLITDSEQIRRVLWKSLRFREKDYFHNRAYQQKKWDGYRDFFELTSGRFLTGLLPEVEMALKYLKVDYVLNDERKKVVFKYDHIDVNFLQQWNTSKKQFILRDYQADLTNKTIKNHRGVVFAPTSAGKTEYMICLLKCLPDNCMTLVLGATKNVCQQNYKRIKGWGFKSVGRLFDRYKEPGTIMCVTFQSLHKLKAIMPMVQAVIVDEIHENSSPKRMAIYRKLANASVRIAVSATPFKDKDVCQKYGVKGHFGPVLLVDSVAAEDGILKTTKLQDMGQLSRCHCTFYPITKPDLKYAIYQDAVTQGIEQNWHFHEIVKRLVQVKCRGRTLIIVERIAHGDALNKLIPGSIWVQGQDDMETREYVINQLSSAKEDVVGIATAGIFNSAINVFVHQLINTAGGQAAHVIKQRFGRGLRVIDDKELLRYYDFVFANNEYLFDHSLNRIKILRKEGHTVDVKEELDF